MSARGLQLCGVGFCRYVFEQGKPNEYIYRMELQKDDTHSKEQYKQLTEDLGIEKVGEVVGWVYFRKKMDANGFNLFSDFSSRISYLNRILVLFGILSAITFLFAFWNLKIWVSGEVFINHLNFIVGAVCLSVAMMIGYGFIKVFRKQYRLKKENVLYE